MPTEYGTEQAESVFDAPPPETEDLFYRWSQPLYVNLLSLLNLVVPRSWMLHDIGCCTGRVSAMYVENGWRSIHLIDVQESWLGMASEKCIAAGASTIAVQQCDITQERPYVPATEASGHAVLCTNVLGYIDPATEMGKVAANLPAEATIFIFNILVWEDNFGGEEEGVLMTSNLVYEETPEMIAAKTFTYEIGLSDETMDLTAIAEADLPKMMAALNEQGWYMKAEIRYADFKFERLYVFEKNPNNVIPFTK